MAYVADLHIHSRYSRACSPQLNVSNLAEWAKLKGINLLGTGDFLHPLWFTELKRDLVEDGSGFLRPKDDQPLAGTDIKFVLSVEIASIYSDKGGLRKVHNIVVLPSFKAVEKLQKDLLKKGAKLASDGRPIVGISCHDLLDLSLQADAKALFVPAHAWTPWFGVFGSKSGYDCLADCFTDLADYVYAIETGISSDPAMNWRVAELDNKSILSFSDAHSLPNLGREATILDGELTYEGLFKAIKNSTVIPANAGIQLNTSSSKLDPDIRRDDRVVGTIEFYPEHGKYHYTGHRKCDVRYTPAETKDKGTVCPKCGRELTVGVMERVEEIASRSSDELEVMSNESGIIKSKAQPRRPGFRKLVPLMQIIAESLRSTLVSQKVKDEYKKLTDNLGREIKILSEVDVAEITKLSGSRLAEGVLKARRGDIVIDPGYDGEYGVVRIWQSGGAEQREEKMEAPQLGLFD